MMDENQFWQIIDNSRQKARERERPKSQDFIDVHEQTLAEALEQLPPAEIAAFDDRFWERHRAAYDWGLWAVAYWLGGGCSDDGFTDFRACLISLGKDPFYRALADPDSLADVVDQPDAPYMQAEGFQYVASEVYERVAGSSSMPRSTDTANVSREPSGERFDFDDEEEMERRFPRIVGKFPEGLD
jgi:hypothetical protein